MGLIHGYYKLKQFYNGLSNRILGIVVLFTIFFVLFVSYWYIFVLSLYTITFEANVGNYHVELINDEFSKKYSFSCPDKKCELRDVAKLDYKVKVLKEFYNPVEFQLNPSIKKSFKINLFKKAILKPIINEKTSNKELTRLEKINLINKKHNNFLFIKLENNEFIFKENNNKLDLYYNNNFIISFEKVGRENISISPVIGNNKYFYISSGNQKILLNKDYLKIIKLNIKLKVNYVKQIDDLNLLFVTDKGSFIFNLKNKAFNYFNTLFDFIILDNGNYIGVLKDKLKSQKKLLGYNISGDLIIYYNPITKKSRLLINPGFDVNKIYMKNNSIFIEDKNQKKYELVNYN